MERWRQVFHEEAAALIQAVKTALTDARAADVQSQPAEWRRADLNEIAQLREHLGELLKSSAPVQPGPKDWLSVDELTRLKELLRSSVGPVTDMARELKRLVATQEAEAFEAAKLRRHIAEDRGQRHLDDRRWARLLERVDELQERFGHLEERVLRQSATERLEERLPEKIEERVRTALEDLSGAALGLCPAVPSVGVLGIDSRAGASPAPHSAGMRFAALTEEVRGASQGRQAGATDAQKACAGVADVQGMAQVLEAQAARIDEHLRRVSSTCADRVAKQEQETERWQVKYEGARAEIRQWRNAAEEAHGECSRLTSEVEELRDTVHWSQQKLRASNTAPALELMQQVQSIEARGNISLNLHSGEVVLLRPLEFVPRKTSEEPSAAFADPDAAQGVIRDIAELASAFGTDLTIKGCVEGGASASSFCQSLAASHARHIKDHIAALGVDRKRLFAKGLPADVGANGASVLVHLDMPSGAG